MEINIYDLIAIYLCKFNIKFGNLEVFNISKYISI